MHNIHTFHWSCFSGEYYYTTAVISDEQLYVQNLYPLSTLLVAEDFYKPLGTENREKTMGETSFQGLLGQ